MSPSVTGRPPVVIAPARGSNVTDTAKLVRYWLVVIAPARGSNAGSKVVTATRTRVVIAPTKGSNAAPTSSTAPWSTARCRPRWPSDM